MFVRKSMILAVMILIGMVCVYAADITGKWTAEFDSQVGLQKYVFEFKADGFAYASRLIGCNASLQVAILSFEGNDLGCSQILGCKDFAAVTCSVR